MNNRHLFLFGGSPPFLEQLGHKFAKLSSKGNGKVVILFIERDGWENYMPIYTGVLKRNSLTNFVYLPLTDTPTPNMLEELSSSSGIIIGGGNTELYRNYIVDTHIGTIIKEKYLEGIPVAGFSAGALISPLYCVIPPIDNVKNEHLFLKGLGLLKDCLISVHFTKWKEEENLRYALHKTTVPTGYGIDDKAGIYFFNEVFTQTEGESVYTFFRCQ